MQALLHPSRTFAAQPGVRAREGLSLKPLTRAVQCRAYKVEIEHQGQTHQLDVPDGENILDVALGKGLELPHDCKLGVCMTCPAKMVSGKVDQSGAMISEDVAAKGYVLMCVAQPTEDCKIMTISEDELLDLQMGS